MKSITVPAQVERLEEVRQFVCRELEAYDCPPKAMFQTELAMEEIFVNIASYAYHPEIGDATVCCKVEEEPLRVTIQFLDQGEPFDPLARPDADISPEALKARVGGLGILLVKQYMDEVSYDYKEGSNILTIQKVL